MTIKESNSNFHPIIILGCGPSSLSAAIQLIRAEIPVLVIAKEVGGLVRNANLIENLLSFPEGITGSNFVSGMKKAINKYHVSIRREIVREVSKNTSLFTIKTDKHEYSCDYLIVGTGTIPNILNIPGEEDAFSGKKLFYNVNEYPQKNDNQRIGIIGSGDAAYDYALNLGKTDNTIEIIQRRAKCKALPLLVQRVREKSNIIVKSQISIRKISVLEGKIMADLESDKGIKVETYDILFVTVGRSPNISFLSPELKVRFEKDPNNERHEQNIWFIGDIKNQKHRQIALALGDGIKAAMQITAMLHK